ncbi:LigA [Anaeromyxobacter sp. Fw109-5]|nr:LigA [Anaeromyxobacter sp. Fw109-5]
MRGGEAAPRPATIRGHAPPRPPDAPRRQRLRRPELRREHRPGRSEGRVPRRLRLGLPGQHAGRGDRARRQGPRREPPLQGDELPERRGPVLERRGRRARGGRGVPLRARRAAVVPQRGLRPLRLRAGLRRGDPLGARLEGHRPRLPGVRSPRRERGGVGGHGAARRRHARPRDVRRRHRERAPRGGGAHRLPARLRGRAPVARDRPHLRRCALHPHALEGPGHPRSPHRLRRRRGAEDAARDGRERPRPHLRRRARRGDRLPACLRRRRAEPALHRGHGGGALPRARSRRVRRDARRLPLRSVLRAPRRSGRRAEPRGVCAARCLLVRTSSSARSSAIRPLAPTPSPPGPPAPIACQG